MIGCVTCARERNSVECGNYPQERVSSIQQNQGLDKIPTPRHGSGVVLDVGSPVGRLWPTESRRSLSDREEKPVEKMTMDE